MFSFLRSDEVGTPLSIFRWAQKLVQDLNSQKASVASDTATLNDTLNSVSATATAASEEAATASEEAETASTEATAALVSATAAKAEADALAAVEYLVGIAAPAVANARRLTGDTGVTLDMSVAGIAKIVVNVLTILGYTPAPINNPTFTGNVAITDAQYFLNNVAGTLVLNWDTDDYLSFVRATNVATIVIGSSAIATFQASGAFLLGTPTAPTAAPGTNSTQLATCAFVTAAAAARVVVDSFNTRTGAVTLTSGDVTSALTFTPANINNPTFTGNVFINDANFFLNITTGSTYLNFDANDYIGFERSTNILTIAIGGSAIATFQAAGAAFSGAPTAATAAPGTNTTQLATTAFVTAAVAAATAGVSSFNTRTGAVTLTSGDVTSALTYTPAAIASPTFTGTPAAPTAAGGTNTTQLATCQFVTAAVAGRTLVDSFNTRTGSVTLTSGDVTGALAYTPANINNPTFTGNLAVTDAQFFLAISSSNPVINMDSNDYLSFDRSTNTHKWIIGGNLAFFVNALGGQIVGEMQSDSLRVNQAETVATVASDRWFPMNINGTVRKVLCAP